MSAVKIFTAIILSATIIFGSFDSSAEAAKKIYINLASRLMLFYDDDTRLAMYHLGVGKVSTPTPTGYYTIASKEINPSWIDPSDPEYEIPSGPENPLGYRWMQLFGNYGIHGTNKPESIGGYVSNGCIRMNERDVEELFDAVSVGTPVEINYNRVVVEKNPEGNIVYYIYPDGYGIQPLTVADVTKWIEPFGVLAFETDYNISQKIEQADGEPTFIGKPYNIEINGTIIQPTDDKGTRFFAKAVLREGITYLPVVPITKALRMKLAWNKTESTLQSRFGKVVCYEKRNQLYCNADDAMILFNVEGGLQTAADGSKIFRYKSIPVVEQPEPPKPEVNKSELPKPEVNKPEPPKPEVNNSESSKPEVNKPEPPKPEVNNSETSKPEVNKPEPPKSEVNKPEPPKPEVNKPEPPKLEQKSSDVTENKIPATQRKFEAANV